MKKLRRKHEKIMKVDYQTLVGSQYKRVPTCSKYRYSCLFSFFPSFYQNVIQTNKKAGLIAHPAFEYYFIDDYLIV